MSERKAIMQSLKRNPIFFNVWMPGQFPISYKPALALHTPQAVSFFVEAVGHASQLFSREQFAICGYEVINDIIEREISQALCQIAIVNCRVGVYIVRESGEKVISAALLAACQTVNERKRVQVV